MAEATASPAPGAMVEESPRSTAASVLAGLFVADEPIVDEQVGPGPFRRRKGASMSKRSSPTKVAAMPYGQPGPSASCARPHGGLQGPAAVPPAFLHGSFNRPPTAATTPMHPLHPELHSALTGALSGTPEHAALGSAMHAPHPAMHGARMLHPDAIAGAPTGVHTPHAMPPPRGAMMMGNGLAGQQQLSLPLSAMRAAPHSQQLSQHLLQQQQQHLQHLPPPQQLTQQHLQQQLLLQQQQHMPQQYLPPPQQQPQQPQPQQQHLPPQQQHLPPQQQQLAQQQLQMQQQLPAQPHLSQQQLLLPMGTAAPPSIPGITPLTQPAMTAGAGARPLQLSLPSHTPAPPCPRTRTHLLLP